MRIHVKPQLGHFARVETNLVDDELRAALDFLLEFEILRNHFSFAQFEIRCDRPDAKLCLQQLLILAVAVRVFRIQPLIHLVQHRYQADGIDVEDRLGETFVSRGGIIAGHGEDIVKALAVEQPRFAFESVPIQIFAGEMNDDFFARVKDRPAEGKRRELRIAAGVIGHGDPVNLGTRDEFVGKGAGLYGAVFGH